MSPEEAINNRMSKFYRGFHFVITSEGGTNHDPVDRGGLTNWGISEKQYPDLDINSISLQDARDIYYRDYWLKNKCDQMGADLAIVLFDCSVNCGQPSGAKWLQKSCNKLGSTLKVDGVIGRKTMGEVFKYSQSKLQELILAERLRRYVWLLKKYPEQKKFIRGWLDRVANLIDFVVISEPDMFKNLKT